MKLHSIYRYFFPRKRSMLALIVLALKENDPYDALDGVEDALLSEARVGPKMRRIMGPVWDALYSDRQPAFKVRKIKNLVFRCKRLMLCATY